MKYIGVLLILGAALVFLKSYRVYLRNSISLTVEFLEFVKRMRHHTSAYLEGVSAWIGDFNSPKLEAAGFVSKVQSGTPLKEAYLTVDKSLISAEAGKVLDALFLHLGAGYLEEEVRLLDSASAELSEIVSREESAINTRVRVVGAFLLSVSVGLVLIIL